MYNIQCLICFTVPDSKEGGGGVQRELFVIIIIITFASF